MLLTLLVHMVDWDECYGNRFTNEGEEDLCETGQSEIRLGTLSTMRHTGRLVLDLLNKLISSLSLFFLSKALLFHSNGSISWRRQNNQHHFLGKNWALKQYNSYGDQFAAGHVSSLARTHTDNLPTLRINNKQT